MVFGEEVGQVGGSGCPMQFKLSLFDSVTEPEKTHVDWFGTAGIGCAIQDSVGGCVVGPHGCWRLLVPQFFQCCDDWKCMFCVEKECRYFSFSSAGADIFDDFGNGCNGSVDHGPFVVVQEVKSAGSASCFGGHQVGCVRMDV